MLRSPSRFSLLLLSALTLPLRGEEPKPDPSLPPDAPPGHSIHGDSFNEGPRRRLPLTPGCGDVDFRVTTSSPEAQQFFNQGVAQLHGFWYWEAERSFRTVLQLDPNCMMAHWGMAMANLENEPRARKLIEKATGPAMDKMTPREKAWIATAQKFFVEKKDDNARKNTAGELVKALERIAMDFPDDIEAKAMAVCFVWRNQYRLGIPNPSPLGIDALARQVLAKNSKHPVHHYLIHLWDHERPAQALEAAAMCGPSAPGVAHMWHMPGHIYSDLDRWQDSAWQQEAAARVDHAQMMRNHIYPDQIHNFAHNSEWLVRNLNHLGRVREALTISTNMISMPRIPRSKEVKADPDQKFEEEGSCWQYGRNRLVETILRWELWDTAIALSATPLLEPGAEFEDQWRREQLLALAWYAKGDAIAGRAALAQLEATEAALQKERSEASAKAEEEARAKNKKPDEIKKAAADAGQSAGKKIEKLAAPLAELRLRDHLAAGRMEEAKKLVPELKDVNEHRLALIHLALGDGEKAVETAKAFAEKSKKQLQPQALYARLLWETGKKDEALAAFKSVRELAAHADMDLAVLQKLQPVADAAGCQGDWRLPAEPAKDLGERPDLASLGLMEWQPWPAPEWAAITKDNQPVTSESLHGKPHILILFLGNACSHCNQQVKAFADKAADFAKAGLPILAISTDAPADIAAAGAPPPFPVYSGVNTTAFRALDAWDDFEDKPLHATCFIDAEGKMRWQHTGYEPFMLPDFLLAEAQRLQKLTEKQSPPVAGKP
jgi:peroxiredoxin